MERQKTSLETKTRKFKGKRKKRKENGKMRQSETIKGQDEKKETRGAETSMRDNMR